MLNFNKQGRAIGINSKTADVLYCSDNMLEEKNEVEMKNLEIIPPCKKNQREVCYIAAPSGAGKSYVCKQYIEKYQKLHKKNDVYIFSKLAEDKTLKDLKKIYRIPIDDDLVENPIEIDELENCLVVFDDIDTISVKAHSLALTQIMNDILEIGRHNNITCLITSHLINGNDKKRCRTIMNESHRVVIFPRTSTFHAVDYFLREYVGVRDKKMTKKIMDLPSRSVCIHKQFPMYVMHQNGAFMI